MTHYHYGQNIPGYLPMADEPNTAETFEGARDGLADDVESLIDHYADVDDIHTEAGYAGSMSAALHVAAAEIKDWTGPDTTYAASDEPHDLGLAFWITACAETECMEDDDELERDGRCPACPEGEAPTGPCPTHEYVDSFGNILLRDASTDDHERGSVTLFVIALVLVAVTIIGSYVGDAMGAYKDARATATSDVHTYDMEEG